ncbi:flagellar motor switch protein FliG [Treponema pallidum]|uniref:Flagellar motor switch protein FliG n=5 Tax=Treponema pallidum TaxID=160 RepID=O83070_TREPA|nr:flagellar motor switch protein FliG [Treponema pallidum]AAC65020.1 flagellar motor switch protein (fliG-1) [Treponema pallidum subsp. pallidum str. Nichols]ACD70453.1 flagellar motor switch protein [Treponema pallidum subsp. pallidum SS14]ADD72176.1 flagellar motor switch protein [Treponema pallidum subsp. pallidum str. Chicago]AEZ57140.1 flagellar motor switch protein FliG [Treponema pallidum subsp. pertenue str. SamoaD]AEZ58208.1 flagellar motor switch protein FliG [Treponema pallidum sub
MNRTESPRGLIKATVREQDRGRTVYKKIAQFLSLIGEEQAALVLKQLEPAQIEAVVAELLTLKPLSPEEAREILREFSALCARVSPVTGGLRAAQSMLSKAFGEEKADLILKRAVPAAQPKPFEFLAALEASQLLPLLEGELPATKTLILSQLPPESAAHYLSNISTEEKKDLIVRLAKLKHVNPQVLQVMSDSLHKKFAALHLSQRRDLDGHAVLAAILKKMERATEHSILHALAEKNPTLAARVRTHLFTLDDIPALPDTFLQKHLASCSEKTLAALINTNHPAFVQKILSNLSKNRAQLVRDEYDTFPPSAHDTRTITEHFLATLRSAGAQQHIASK